MEVKLDLAQNTEYKLFLIKAKHTCKGNLTNF